MNIQSARSANDLPASAADSTTASTPSAGSNQAAAPSAFDLDAIAPDTKVDRISATVPWRGIKTTVIAKARSEISAQTAGKSPDGTWELL
jgi:hypothetical protein